MRRGRPEFQQLPLDRLQPRVLPENRLPRNRSRQAPARTRSDTPAAVAPNTRLETTYHISWRLRLSNSGPAPGRPPPSKHGWRAPPAAPRPAAGPAADTPRSRARRRAPCLPAGRTARRYPVRRASRISTSSRDALSRPAPAAPAGPPPHRWSRRPGRRPSESASCSRKLTSPVRAHGIHGQPGGAQHQVVGDLRHPSQSSIAGAAGGREFDVQRVGQRDRLVDGAQLVEAVGAPVREP